MMDHMRHTQVNEFMTAAEGYCRLLEKAAACTAGDFFTRIQQYLPYLYQKAALLTKPKYCYEEGSRNFVSEDDYARIHDVIQQKIELCMGIRKMYPDVRPPRYEMLSFSLAEILTDIYLEVKNIGFLYRSGVPQAVNDAIWLACKGFEKQLGSHLAEAIKALHQMLYDHSFEGARALQNDDFADKDEEGDSWYTDEQEEIYEDDE